MEENVGHTVLAHQVRNAFAQESEVESRYVPVCFYEEGGLVERAPFLPIYLRASYRARLEINKGLRGWRPDALLWNTQKPAMFAQGLLQEVPSVISTDVTPIQYDALADVYGHHGDGSGLVTRAKFLAASRVFRLAKRLAPWTDWVADSLKHDYGVAAEKIQVVPPGTDLQRFCPPARKPSEADGLIRLLFVGGDFERKGGHELLAWFSSSAIGRRCVLDLVTTSDVEVPANVRLHRLSHEDDRLTRLFQEADIFVFPTKGECFGIVLIEAMAAGLPCVTCPVDGVPSIIQEGVSGLYASPGDVHSLGVAVEGLINDASLRDRLGRRARELAVERYDLHTNSRRLLDLLREAAADQG